MTLWERLRRRHSKDFFLLEVKDGPTQSGTHRRIDAWVLVRTWSPPTIIGYEVKLTRSDWLRDQKFESYRQMCHLLYVVALPGVVQVAELPAGVGLLEPLGTERLKMKVKAARRDGPIVESVYQYILMARVKEDNRDETKAERVSRWKQELAERRFVGQAISQEFYQMRADIAALRARQQRLAVVESVAREMGLPLEYNFSEERVRAWMRDHVAGLDGRFVRDLELAAKRLVYESKTIEDLAAKMRGANERRSGERVAGVPPGECPGGSPAGEEAVAPAIGGGEGEDEADATDA